MAPLDRISHEVKGMAKVNCFSRNFTYCVVKLLFTWT